MPSPRRLFAALCLLAASPTLAAEKLRCRIPAATAAAPSKGDPKVREAAQRGLEFLARSTAEWANTNRCYGCHVQAVTIEGLSVGTHHQYDVPTKEFRAIVDSILNHSGGARQSPRGLYHSGYPKTARTFGGAAFARYDQWVDAKLRDDLVKVARQLLEQQQTSGAVVGDHQSYPVTAGTMQSTYQAAQTWRQAYARTADAAWLTPIQRAEAYIQKIAGAWGENPKGVYLQDVNYALMGLTAAGVGTSEATPARLVRHLLSLQSRDGGWGFGGASEAYATGQTLYALRMAGLTDAHSAVSRGTGFLVEHQNKGGGWGAAGSGKAEAMWAVLGLVSVDVLTVAVRGVSDGQRASEVMALEVEAKDNKGSGVERVELFVDDLPLHAACGGKLSYPWNTRSLSEGKHVLDVVATNAKGESSRRRFEVYAGNVFFTQLGTRFDERGLATEVSLRNIAPEGHKGTVELKVFAAEGEGQPKMGKELFSTGQKSAQGPMAFRWDGKGKDGKLQKKGRYFAQVSFRDESGKTVQHEDALFFQDTEEAQRAQFGEVEGSLSLKAGSGEQVAANALVELLDEKGNLVQATRATQAGQYRFKNVDKGNYRVRVKKDGFADREAPVQAAPAQESSAHFAIE
ncbi:MAG: carboxypeptidase regulatory-like domain-containing protein [Myxococcales bacterium]|nr:carboxypeptidase regulatory-like domain-containing protein [Myxococcales bacterium]